MPHFNIKLHFVLHSTLFLEFLTSMRSDDWGCNIASDIFDIGTTAIVIIGNAKDNTPFHLDWTKA